MTNANFIEAASRQDDSTNLVLHHLSSFQNNDLDAVTGDYTSDSILITQDGTYNGVVEIRSFFAGLMPHFPSKQTDFKLEKLIVNNELAFITWQANTPSLRVAFGTDTFIIKNNKIFQQTFAGQMHFV